VTKPRRLCVESATHADLPEGVCWIGEASAYANPFPVETRGNPSSHAEAAEAYLRWLLEPGRAALRARVWRELRGLDLACDCPSDLPCHGDVLLELVNGEAMDDPGSPDRASRSS
jgi:hypothetical protein